MTNYIVTNKAEALYEKFSRVLSDYERYMNYSNMPFDGIEMLYNKLLTYRQKIILCEDEETYLKLLSTINQYDTVISSLVKSGIKNV